MVLIVLCAVTCPHTSDITYHERRWQLRLERYGFWFLFVCSKSLIDICTAVAFGYFENLFALRDLVLIQNELVRLKSLSSLLDQVGHQDYLYEIFVDATEQVFAQLIQAIQDGVHDDSFLVNTFNVEYSSNAILTHFRVGLPCLPSFDDKC